MNGNEFLNAEENLRRSWEVHRQAFGPILEPAFQENKEVRVHLVAALNLISRREVKKGYDILMSIKKHCIYDEDKAAWNFFIGLCFEFMGSKEQMLKWYEKANDIGHNFYLPYLKVAKIYHNEAKFGLAEKNYIQAIKALENIEEIYKDDRILGSAYTNLCSCLTMMHAYKMAETALKKAEALPLAPGASATAAILYAAMGERGKSESYIEKLKTEFPLFMAQTKKVTEEILKKTHPHFNSVELVEEKAYIFWKWLLENLELFINNDEKINNEIKLKLKELFPYLEREAKWERSFEEDKLIIKFSDFYAFGLNFGYQSLISLCPDEILSRVSFKIVR